jgi:SulP family sulfate permease
MSEGQSIMMVLKSPKSDVLVLLTTFTLTVVLDLTVAIQAGVLLAVFSFMRRMALVTNVSVITKELEDEEETDDPNAIAKRQVPEGVEVYEINGPFFFGASYKFMEAMKVTAKTPKVRIVRMRNVLTVDATGINTLREEYKNSKKHGIAFILSDVHSQPLMALERASLLEAIGEENIFGNIDDSLDRARHMLGLPAQGHPDLFIPTVKREETPRTRTPNS